ncbi:type IX secretion system outer membrane channel protein PorV [uncultured Microscilla sp.]|uniref:type IX secretion system outer membrane channel protein PorV n=1 Tax=uncultured Microscilla sp. TaxID=432653 RepID=UPI0026373B0B|nr:type IX secretion system outer membrane channel protein PorV [uncultured Microscilla sp.]
MLHKSATLFVWALVMITQAYGQVQRQNFTTLIGQNTSQRAVRSAVPFLTIAPDARSTGMGEVGVATKSDVNDIYWNPAKLAFIDNKASFSFAQTPWLQVMTEGLYLYHLTGNYKISPNQSMGIAVRYFDLGDLDFVNASGQISQQVSPREFAVTFAYSRKLSNHFSAAVSGRFIHSNVSADVLSATQLQNQAGATGSGDISVFYKNEGNFGTVPVDWAVGAHISNIGPKISYDNKAIRGVIPTNFRLGTSVGLHLDALQLLTVGVDFNKLLVPSPPVVTPEGVIIKGSTQDKPVIRGIVESFADAPEGWREELQEITWAVGLEYWYDNTVAARLGYFSENPTKGDRRFFTLGMGVKYKAVQVDVSYVLTAQHQHPLSDTFRIGMIVNFGEPEVTIDESDD